MKFNFKIQHSTRQMKDMSQIDLKFDSELNAFGLTDDFDDLYIQKSQPVANGWLLVILDFNTHKTIAQDSYKSHHVHPDHHPIYPSFCGNSKRSSLPLQVRPILKMS